MGELSRVWKALAKRLRVYNRNQVAMVNRALEQRDTARRHARAWKACAREYRHTIGLAYFAKLSAERGERVERQMRREISVERDEALHARGVAESDLATARRELGEVRALVEEHRKRSQSRVGIHFDSYSEGREDALNELCDAIEALGKEQGNE